MSDEQIRELFRKHEDLSDKHNELARKVDKVESNTDILARDFSTFHVSWKEYRAEEKADKKKAEAVAAAKAQKRSELLWSILRPLIVAGILGLSGFLLALYVKFGGTP